MNLLVTIFGGMLLTVTLYAGARASRLSNFWAAVLASGLPSFAYLVYAVKFWPGLDVVTLHVIAFPTVAVLLFQLYGEKAGRQQGVHWAPKLMVAFFVAITVIFGGFVYIAGQGLPPALARLLLPGAGGKNLHTGFAGVVAHGEDAAKGIGHHLGMESKLARLGWRLDVAGLDALRPDRVTPVRVRVTDGQGRGVGNVAVRLTLSRPGQTESHSFALADAGDGRHQASLSLPAKGAWVASLRLDGAGEPLVFQRTLGSE